MLDLAALRTCLELGAERDWTASELKRLDPLFDAATARSKGLEQWLATPQPTNANEILRRIAWRRELARLAKEREEIGGVLPRHLTRFVEVNNEFMKKLRESRLP